VTGPARVARTTLLRLVVWGAFVTLGLAGVVRTGLTAGPVGGVFATAQSLVEQGAIAVDGNTAMIGALDAPASGLAYVNNHFVAAADPGAAFVAAPAAWFGLPLADGLHHPDAAILLVGVTAVLLLLLAAAALAWAGGRLGLSSPLALLGGAFGVGTLLFPVGALTDAALTFAITALLLALTFADGADSRVEEGWTPHGRLTLAGLLLGCLPFAVWYGWLAAGCVGIALVAQGGRRWWRRVLWLLLGGGLPAALFLIYNIAWFGRPWRGAWLYAIGDPWQRTIRGRFFATPVTSLRASFAALGELAARHPLIVVGLIGLGIGLYFVPWRARVTTAILFLTLGVPALLDRQPPGMAAEVRPILVLGAFAAIGYILLVAVIARERPRFVPAVMLAGIACVGAGIAVSVATKGADRPALVPIGGEASAYVAPVALCTGAVILLLVSGLSLPRVRRERIAAIGGVAILLTLSLSGCGAVSPATGGPVSSVPNLLPPVATRLASGTINPLWTLDANARIAPDGTTLTAFNETGTAASPRVPVQAGDGYRLSAHIVLAQGGAGTIAARVLWTDAMFRPLAESPATLAVGVPSAASAAPAGAAYASVALSLPPGALVDTIHFQPLDGGRLDALPNYAKAALAFSFDFETAMGGLIHTRGGQTDHDVSDAIARGMLMRNGANFLRQLFAAYDTRATFYVNGYNFLTGNTLRRQFVGNPTYTRYTATTAGFASDYWATHPWYGDDPFGTEETDPAWYFGSLTKQLAQDGHDIESHTFGHLFLHAGITAQQLDDDLTAWDAVAKESGFAPAHSFAFPWRASNSLTAEYYAVLAKHGITNVTRYYDLKPGTYDLQAVPVYPQIKVVPDQELIDRAGDEESAMRGIDVALATGGVFSLWTHPEEIATPAAQAIWGRVVAYAADRRSLGLWVAPVTTITNFVDAREQLRVSSVRVGATTMLTVRDNGQAGVNDTTLTLPGVPKQVTWRGGAGARDINGAQIRVGNILPGETITIEARYT
jgi:peptidoglycan/xylan/chitin deacetylase (PgdA/CDA1 family)